MLRALTWLASLALFAGLAALALAQSVPAVNAPIAGTGLSAGMYASTCSVTVNSSTPTSTFCPPATDPNSVTKRTIAPNPAVGRAWSIGGGGTYTVPTGNLLAADVAIKFGSATVMSITTPAAPVGTNQGVDFHALCTVRTTTTIACQGVFAFVVAGATGAPVAFSQVGTFDPSVSNLIDVLGDWNGTTSTHATTVTQAVLTALN